MGLLLENSLIWVDDIDALPIFLIQRVEPLNFGVSLYLLHKFNVGIKTFEG